MLPGLIEPGGDVCGLGRFLLHAKCTGEAEQGPAVLGPADEIFAINRLGLRIAVGVHQRRAERVPRREDPLGRFDVLEGILAVDGFSQAFNGLIDFAFSIENFAGQHAFADGKHGCRPVPAEEEVI